MGFWSSIKDVLISGTTTAVKNERAEHQAEKQAKEQAKAPTPAKPKAKAPAETKYRTYTVKSGDTLSEIAYSYGVDWHEMAKLNELENPDLIFPGQVFKVPNS